MPEGLPDQPSLPDIEARSRAGGSRLDAERFALAVAQLLCDVRGPVDGARAVGSIAATSMDPTLEITLVNERNDQQAAGTQRRFDATLDMWIRSEVVGAASSPSRVNVEIVGNLASDPMRYHAWYSTRYDVVREGDEWRLIGYHDGVFGPHTKRNLTPRQQHKYLTGPGWRRIPAAA